jgi:hypothetical protein
MGCSPPASFAACLSATENDMSLQIPGQLLVKLCLNDWSVSEA